MTHPEDTVREDYWTIIEAALTALPEEYPLRADGLDAFDHLKERVLTGHADLVAERDRLVAALERIADGIWNKGSGKYLGGAATAVESVRKFARETLHSRQEAS